VQCKGGVRADSMSSLIVAAKERRLSCFGRFVYAFELKPGTVLGKSSRRFRTLLALRLEVDADDEKEVREIGQDLF